MKRLAPILMLVVLTGCSKPAAPPSSASAPSAPAPAALPPPAPAPVAAEAPAAPIDPLIQKAEKATANSLPVPDSAKFRNVAAHGAYVCGEVDGQNASGDDLGYRRFVYDPGFGGFSNIEEAQFAHAFAFFWSSSCGQDASGPAGSS